MGQLVYFGPTNLTPFSLQGHADGLFGRVDAGRMVMAGHSFGGCSAIVTV
jgi:predicted dienelactone hydrolase